MLSQKTNFAFEILINDDASTDGTSEILREYHKKFPETIKPFVQSENQYSKGKRNFIVRFLLPRAKGEYVAICEGDDYWTDPLKLQKQIDFMDSHPDYALCFHPVRVIFENKQEDDSIFPVGVSGFTIEKLLESNFIQTNSVMYRRRDNYSNAASNVMPADWYLHLYHAQFGKIGFINEVMSVYRRHLGGIWWDSHKNLDKLWIKHGIQHLGLFYELLKLYGSDPKYKKHIQKHMTDMFEIFLELDDKNQTELVTEAVTQYPECGKYYILNLKTELDGERKNTANLKIELDETKRFASQTASEIKDIKDSRIWKMWDRLATLMGKKAD